MPIIFAAWRGRQGQVRILVYQHRGIESGKDDKKEALSAREEELKKEKEALLKENAGYESEFEALRQEAAKIELEEKEYWNSIASYERKLIETEREHSKIDNLLERMEEEKKRIEELTVLNDLFKISTDGDVGTINGFKFGRVPDEKVSRTILTK